MRGMDSEIGLGTDVATGSSVSLGLRERQQGTYIIGKPGTGKTTLIEHMVVQDIEHEIGVCVLDPHGDLIDAILTRIPETRERDVILLDAGDTGFPFGVNLFECRDLSDRALVGRVATQAVEVFEKIWGDTSWGPQLAQVLRNCAYTMVENQGYTLTEIRRLLTDDEFRARLVANLTLRQAREFWEFEYNPLPKREQLQRISSTLNKVDEFLTPAIEPIVGFGRTTVDFRQAMDEGKVVLVKLPVGRIGSAPVALLGSIIVAQLFNAALSRQDGPPGERRQFNLFADEYHRFATPTFAELLAEARKYGVATTLAHQFREQLDDQNRGATLTAGNLIVFAVSGVDAEDLAKQFDRTPPPPDLAGRRARLGNSPRPIEHLVAHPQDDPEVRRVAQGWLQRLLRLAALGPDEFVEIRAPNWVWRAGPAAAREGLQLINQYLNEMVEGQIAPASGAEVSAILGVAEVLRGFIGFAPELNESDIFDPPFPYPDETKEALSGYVSSWLDTQARYDGGGLRLDKGSPSLRSELALEKARLSWWEHRFPGADPYFNGERAHSEVTRLWSFVNDLRLLADAVTVNPILVESGQWDAIHDRPRSYSDMEGEVASRLANLPKYHARAKLLLDTGVREAEIQAPKFETRHPTAADQARFDRIRAASRAAYCLPWAQVSEQIARRGRNDLDHPGPAQRRVPL